MCGHKTINASENAEATAVADAVADVFKATSNKRNMTKIFAYFGVVLLATVTKVSDDFIITINKLSGLHT